MSLGSAGSGGSKSRSFLSLALWELSSPARCQALIVLGCTPSCCAVSWIVSSPRARSRSWWLGSWWARRMWSTIVAVNGLSGAGLAAGGVELLGGLFVGVVVE